MKNPKSSQINIRFTAEERDLIERAAENDKRTLSDWVRVQAVHAANMSFYTLVKPSKKGKK